MGFQTAVSSRQAPAVAGDFASDNPREFFLSGPGGLVAGSSGLVIGRAAWVSPTSLDWDAGATIANNAGFGNIDGIVPRRFGNALITTFLSDNGNTIPQGYPVGLLTGGDIWLKNDGTGQAVKGQKAYAKLVDGTFTFAATATPTTASCATASIAAGTAATFTGSITNNVLTTSGTVTNTIYPGAILTGGTGIPTGAYVVAQLSGTAGGAGTYAVSVPELTVASASLTATPMVLTQGTVTGTALAVGGVIASASTGTTGTVIGMAIMASVTATTWSLAPAPGVTAAGTNTSATITVASNVETKWRATHSALAGELVKCTSVNTGIGA